MSCERAICSVCRQEVYRNGRGQILMHTGRPDFRNVIDVCPGSTKGARP